MYYLSVLFLSSILVSVLGVPPPSSSEVTASDSICTLTPGTRVQAPRDIGNPYLQLGLVSFDLFFERREEFVEWRKVAESQEDVWVVKDLGNVHPSYRVYHASVASMLWNFQIIVPEGPSPLYLSHSLSHFYTYRKAKGKMPRGILFIGTAASSRDVGTVFTVDNAFDADTAFVPYTSELAAEVASQTSPNANTFLESWRNVSSAPTSLNTFSTSSLRGDLAKLLETISSKNLDLIDSGSFAYFYTLKRLDMDLFNFGAIGVVAHSTSQASQPEGEGPFTKLFAESTNYLRFLYHNLNQLSYTTEFRKVKANQIHRVVKPNRNYNTFGILVSTNSGEKYFFGALESSKTIVLDCEWDEKFLVKDITYSHVDFKFNFPGTIQVMFFNLKSASKSPEVIDQEKPEASVAETPE